MSWDIFKQNILNVVTNPETIKSTDEIADLYAKEYDAAIKRGFDTSNGTKVKNGDVASMKQFFLSALQKGLTSTQPYDLVGEMGQGVLAYWSTAVLGNEVVPVTPAIGATSNVSVVSNVVTNPGIWQRPVTQLVTSFELTAKERIEYQEKLEKSTQKYEQAVEQKQPVVASTHLDEVNKYQSILEQNETYRIDIPYTPSESSNTAPSQTPTPTPGPTPTPAPTPTPSTTITTTLPPIIDAIREGEEDDDVRVSSEEDIVVQGQFSEGKPWNVGFRGGLDSGGFGSGGYNVAYVPFPNDFPANASLGTKAVTIALYDLAQGVKEVPKDSDTGHDRIKQMQKNGAGGGTGFPWCACAVTTWWQEAGVVIANHANKAYVPTWVSWAVANNRFVDKREGANSTYLPKPGDAIVYGWGSLNNDHNGFDHIGLVWKVENGVVYGIDGNWSASVSTHVANPKTIRGYILI